MGNIATITLNDGASSPVAHSFDPAGKDINSVVIFKDKVLGVSVGFPALSLQIRAPNRNSRNYKVTGKIVVPTLEVVAGDDASGFTPAPVKAYDCLGTFEFVLPERSTLQERKNILAYVKNSLANALIASMVTDYVDLY